MKKPTISLLISVFLLFLLTACGDSSSTVAEFSVPEEYGDTASDICVSQSGRIYIAAGSSILEYTTAGEESQVIQLPGRKISVVAASRDVLYAYDISSHTVLEIDEKGDILRLIPLTSSIGYVTKLLASEDALYLMYENASYDNELLSVSVSDESETLLPIPDLYDAGLYDKDHLLVRQKTALSLYDLTTQETEETTLYYNLPFFGGGYAYDPQGKLLYYIANNTLYRMEEKSQEHSVVKLLDQSYHKMAFLADTIVLFDPEAKYICALNPKTYTEETATVRTYEFEKYSHYVRNYTADTGVEVVDVLGAVDERFLKQLLAGDSKVDIYVLSSSDIHSLEFLVNHAYTDLSVSETLVNTVDRMHRSLRDSVWQGEELAGIPLEASGIVMAFNTESEAYSLAEERITDWDSLLLFLEELPPESTILANKAGMYQRLFEQYLYGYCEPYEGKVDFDTEIFRKTLDLMTRIHDCPDFQDPGTDPGDFRMSYSSDRDFRQTDVLGINSFLRLGNIASPHKLPDIEATRSLAPQISVSYAVINPNSENKEAAIRYLETLVTGEEFSSLPEMFPTSENENLNLYMDEAFVQFDQGVLNNVVSILYSYMDGKISKEELIAAIQEKADLILAE